MQKPPPPASPVSESLLGVKPCAARFDYVWLLNLDVIQEAACLLRPSRLPSRQNGLSQPQLNFENLNWRSNPIFKLSILKHSQNPQQVQKQYKYLFS